MSNRKKEVHGDPYENLANAIILRAVWDYQAALRRYRRTFEVSEEMIRCEKFFRSSWYEVLSDVDGEYLIKKLRKEAGV